MLPKPIQTRTFRQPSSQPQVLCFEDQRCCRGVEQDFARKGASDGEAKRVRLIMELYLVATFGMARRIWALKDLVGNLIDLLGGILNEDVNSRV